MTYLTKSSIDAVRRFNRFYTRRIGVLKPGMVGSPHPLPEARVLYELGQVPQATATVLGKALGMDLGYLSRLVQGLKRRGLLQAKRAPHDGRHSFLSLTEKGRKAYTMLNTRSRDEMGAMLAPMPSPQRTRLVAAMRTVESLLGGEAERGEVALRAPRAGDMGWVVERHAAVYYAEWGWGAPFEALVAGIVKDFLEKLDPARERCWIAERDGERVGCVFVVDDGKGAARLRLLLVEPAARGTGLGKRLVEECIRFARAKGYRRMVLWTHANLLAARGIYRKLGFNLDKTWKHREFGADVVAENWSLALRPARRGT
jgi:DNA-binding MarR family transcriptional regulator/N-acetylglutamate synthase-like GNAT family acetyltransferase